MRVFVLVRLIWIAVGTLAKGGEPPVCAKPIQQVLGVIAPISKPLHRSRRPRPLPSRFQHASCQVSIEIR